ncbi:MAG TPA: peptidylprolyl isomerase [Steroidobacteraceae bacterium]|nr:peptidylprolyl isomerase [Steroidobacteraceae bacterium]
MRRRITAWLMAGFAGTTLAAGETPADQPPTSAQLLEAAQASDWRRPDPGNTLYLDLPTGRVIIELAPRIAPAHVANIKALARAKFFDGLPLGRVQDNYVTQWGDIDEVRSNELANRKLPDETTLPWSAALPIVELPDVDGYAPRTGWLDGFPVGIEREPAGQVWMTHCYGSVGVARDDWPDTGSGAQLYAVIGQAPRHLDRNIVLVGRVIRGMELLSSLPRGNAPLGFYTEEEKARRTRIVSVRLAADLPESQRTPIELLRTDTPLFAKYVEARRNRREPWFVRAAGHIDVCNLAIPSR